MRARLRVPLERLTTRVDERTLGFTSTREVASLEGTIGQDRALRALEFGLGATHRVASHLDPCLPAVALRIGDHASLVELEVPVPVARRDVLLPVLTSISQDFEHVPPLLGAVSSCPLFFCLL